MALEKAKIVSLDGPSIRLECYFNPSRYSLTKSNEYTAPQGAADKMSNVPKHQYTGTSPINLSMELFFDTSETGSDVRSTYTNKLLQMMYIKEGGGTGGNKLSEPPKVQFQWGKMWSFTAVIKQVRLEFNMFKNDGTPIRAKASVEFMQHTDDQSFPAQNPTSGGEVRKSYLVNEGDRLDLIAFRAYNDSQKWRLIAEANGIENPLSIKPGQRLLLPALE